jgi:hypothetical protein
MTDDDLIRQALAVVERAAREGSLGDDGEACDLMDATAAHLLAVAAVAHDHWLMCTHENHGGDPCVTCEAYSPLLAALRAHRGAAS